MFITLLGSIRVLERLNKHNRDVNLRDNRRLIVRKVKAQKRVQLTLVCYLLVTCYVSFNYIQFNCEVIP